MNTTQNVTCECYPLGVYCLGEPPVPAALLWVSLVHSYGIIVFGTLGNALALWCVETCTRTRLSVKMLLFSVFLPILVICLGTMPVLAEFLTGLLTCDPNRISKTAVVISVVLNIILGRVEQIAIAALAVARTVTVWAPHKPKLGTRGAMVLLVATCIYAILTAVMDLVVKHENVTHTIFAFVNAILPTLITAAGYIFVIIGIQRSQHSLEVSQQQARVATMNQATKAMLAVFISNLVFHVPHSIFHILGKQPIHMSVIFHFIFFTHYTVDPMLYMWFNIGYRKKILSSMIKVIQSLSSLCTTLSVTQTETTASRDHLHHHDSPTHTQDDSNV